MYVMYMYMLVYMYMTYSAVYSLLATSDTCKSRTFCLGHPNNEKITTWFGIFTGGLSGITIIIVMLESSL